MPDINGIPYVESTDLVSAYPAASQALAQEISDQLASKVDYALPVNAQTGTTYTFVAADAEKLTTASNAAAVTLTIPPQSSVTWSDNTVLRVVNYGAGAVTIDGGSGVTVTNTSSTIAQYGAAVAIRTGSDAWTVVPFGGGDVPSATVSSPAATGQYTDTGITYDYYTFTASGTLTVDTAGFADVLVVGGGGGGNSSNFGAGAGGMYEASNYYLAAGAHTVTVGAGGATASAMGGDSSLADFTMMGGGGGGTGTANKTGGSGGGGTTAYYTGAPGVPGQGNQGSSQAGGGKGSAASSASTGGSGLATGIAGSTPTTTYTAGTFTFAAGGNSSGGGAATANSGNGGNGASGTGGSGIVIVRVKV